MPRDTTQHRAQQAADILELPAMRDAREAVRNRVYTSWVACSDAAERDKLHSIAVANEELWKVLRGYHHR